MAKCPYPHIMSFTRLLCRMEERRYCDVTIDCIKEMLQVKAPVNPLILEIEMKCLWNIGQPLLALGLVGAFHKRGCEPCCGVFMLAKHLYELKRSFFTDHVIMFRLATAFHGLHWGDQRRPYLAELVLYVSAYRVLLPHTKFIKLRILNVDEHEFHREGEHLFLRCILFILALVIVV